MTHAVVRMVEIVNERAKSHAVFAGEFFVVVCVELVEQTSGIYCAFP